MKWKKLVFVHFMMVSVARLYNVDWKDDRKTVICEKFVAQSRYYSSHLFDGTK
jgi:hypothetical protein